MKRYVNVLTEEPSHTFSDQPSGNDATIVEVAAEEAPSMSPRMNDHNGIFSQQPMATTVDLDFGQRTIVTTHVSKVHQSD